MHFPSCRVLDLNDGSLVNRLDHHSGPVLCVRFNSDTMVTGSGVLCILVYIHDIVLLKYAVTQSYQRQDMNGLLPPISSMRCL